MAHGLQIVGTLKLNRTGIPENLKHVKMFDKHAARGTMWYEQEGDTLFVQSKDRRTVTMLSTVHSGNDSVQVTRNTKVNGEHVVLQLNQPKCIQDYNAHMGDIDVFDQHVAAHRSLRKTNK